MEQKLDQLKNEFYRTAEENKGLKKVSVIVVNSSDKEPTQSC